MNECHELISKFSKMRVEIVSQCPLTLFMCTHSLFGGRGRREGPHFLCVLRCNMAGDDYWVSFLTIDITVFTHMPSAIIHWGRVKLFIMPTSTPQT